MTPFIDSHAHLDGDDYQSQIDEVLVRAAAVGVTQIVCIGASAGYDSNPKTVELVQDRPSLYATVGIHPHDAQLATPEVIEKIRGLAQREKVVAIGEIGLDYYYDHSPRADQHRAFRAFLGVARERKLPVVIHTRDAEDDTLQILKDEGAQDLGGVIHCFTGTEKLAQGALDLGFCISFSGVLTFKSADPLRAIARDLPRDRVLVETDCPYLTPVPLRGKKNEPAYVLYTAQKLAELWQVDLDQVKRQTAENTRRLFRLAG